MATSSSRFSFQNPAASMDHLLMNDRFKHIANKGQVKCSPPQNPVDDECKSIEVQEPVQEEKCQDSLDATALRAVCERHASMVSSLKHGITQADLESYTICLHRALQDIWATWLAARASQHHQQHQSGHTNA